MGKIVFHDNKNGAQYGPDGRLTDNWNPNGGYPEDEYIKVYFRIETPSYYRGTAGVGFDSEKERCAFYGSAAKALAAGGWTVDDTTDAEKGKAHLYIHPQNISGTVLKNDVGAIAELLRVNGVFSLSWVDVYETVYDFDDKEYEARLKESEEKIRGLLLKHGVTKRRDTFHTVDSLTVAVADSVRLLRVGKTDGCGYNVDRVACAYVRSVLTQLVKEGYMIEVRSEDRALVRTINKTEQKQRKLTVDAA